MTSRAIVAAIATLTACIGFAVAPPGSAAPGRVSCPAQGGYQISLYQGDISCAVAYATASQYEVNGPQSQRIGPFLCGNFSAEQKANTSLLFGCIHKDSGPTPAGAKGGFSVSRA